jgi:hypothetical protein
MPDKIIFKEPGITLETPPEPAGPLELANLMVELRHVDSFPKSHLSDVAVCKLLELSFYLSMRADEGRFPRLRIISGERDDYRLAVKFTTPLKFDDVHELRRLTPVAGSPDFALLVSESQDGELECPGLANIGHLGLQSIPGRPEIVPVGGPPTFRIWIEGPGHLFVQESATSLEFRAGRVRLVVPALYTIPKLRQLTSHVGEILHRRSCESVEEISDADKYFGGNFALSELLNVMLRRLLDTCLELRHGGAFVILPGEDKTPESFDVSCKYPLESPDLGDDIANYWSTHIQACSSKKEGVDKYETKLRACNQSKARLLTNVDAIANMSAADGCVVMTEQLRLLGFGGAILVSEDEVINAQTKVRLSKDSPCDIDCFLRNVGGQRHQSAARLVIKHPDIIVFVVSQDGELSVFASDEEAYIRVYRPVDPFITP